MNLDMLYLTSEITGDMRYADIATRQAEKSLKAHVRPDGTTYHVVDFHQDGTVKAKMTHQGYEDESTWSRGQAWAIYGYAQCGEHCLHHHNDARLRTASIAYGTERFHSDHKGAGRQVSGAPPTVWNTVVVCPYPACHCLMLSDS